MPRLSRRTFLKGTAGVSAMSMTALSYSQVVGANDRILLGQIGCGDRGCRAHMAGIHKHDAAQNVQYIAVADPWRVSRENGAKLIKEWYGRDAKQMASYRDLLAIKEIDAVMIASPDYHHTTHLEAAARAGKHVYVEKPMAMRLDRLLSAYDAVKQAGVIVQVGTQSRSQPSSFGLRALWKSGVLGKASRIEQARNGEKPYWYHYLKKDVRKEDVDWDEFLMDLPKRPFDANLFSGWYGYREFSDGPVPNLGAPFRRSGAFHYRRHLPHQLRLPRPHVNLERRLSLHLPGQCRSAVELSGGFRHVLFQRFRQWDGQSAGLLLRQGDAQDGGPLGPSDLQRAGRPPS